MDKVIVGSEMRRRKLKAWRKESTAKADENVIQVAGWAEIEVFKVAGWGFQSSRPG